LGKQQQQEKPTTEKGTPDEQQKRERLQAKIEALTK